MKREKTAVEWLIDQLAIIGLSEELIGHLNKEAKAMEKEQMKQMMWDLTDVDMTKTNKGLIIDSMFKRYYNETYGDEKRTNSSN